MSNSTLSQWNGAADWYNQNMGEAGDELNRELIRPALLEMIGNLSGKTVLDIGCGSGYFTVELASKAQKVVGTDFSPEFVSLCQQKYQNSSNLTFMVQDVMKPLDFTDNSFNAVVVKMVLQYTENITLFAQEAARVITPKGSVYVVVDHPFNAQFYYAQSLAGKNNPKYEGLKDYFSKDIQTKLSLWGKVELTWYPKTVGDYLMPFINAGLKLVDLRELAEQKENTKIPRIFAFTFQKE